MTTRALLTRHRQGPSNSAKGLVAILAPMHRHGGRLLNVGQSRLICPRNSAGRPRNAKEPSTFGFAVEGEATG